MLLSDVSEESYEPHLSFNEDLKTRILCFSCAELDKLEHRVSVQKGWTQEEEVDRII